MNKKITMKTIANEAGVSVMTVSNVINNKKSSVSEKTKDKILELIQKYEYTPNLNARALNQGSTRLIGLLYYSNEWNVNFSDSFVSEVLEGMERVAKERGYFTLLYNANSSEEITLIQNNWKFDGFIIIGVTKKFFKGINEKIFAPVVYVDTYVPEQERIVEKKEYMGFVNSDDYSCGKKAVEYLISRGHEKIAFLTYERDISISDVNENRYKGFLEGLAQQGYDFDTSHYFTLDDFKMIEGKMDEFTAVSCTSDFLALELVHYLKKRGLYKKRELSIIGIDDIKYAAIVDPPLTTINLEQSKKGSIAMEMLLDVVEGKEQIKNKCIQKGQLVVRESCFEKRDEKNA